jgi:uncharacterized protein (UPF0276 family)
MTTSTITQLPSLGAGIGYRSVFRSDLFLNRSATDFLEIVADHYLDATAEAEEELALLEAHYPLIPHGINLSLGSAEGVDMAYARKFASLVNRLKPAWWSEHISFTRAGGIDIGHLTPLPFTREAVDTFCRNVREVQALTDTPLILENISYVVNLPVAEMTEAQFLTEILERTGCGLLLDVTNLYLNSINSGYDAIAFLGDIPLDRIVQLHFVGGRWVGGVYVDSHSEATPQEVWDLLDEVVRRAPVKGVLLERDDNMPPFDELAGEVDHARRIMRGHGRWA